MTESTASFRSLGLDAPFLDTLSELGYEQPSAIQAESIPVLLEGHDIIGQAQTGTGKTAAFALPLLSRIDTSTRHPQILVLTPTRELAIQVAEAFQVYSRNLPGFHVVPIYGGQAYGIQLRQLRRGPQVIVGTPGRVIDHIRRETLDLSALRAIVLDEADEMLRMGFIDDVDWILGHTPEGRQTALFSATMPKEIQKVAAKHLTNPKLIKIAATTTTAKTIRQRYWQVSGLHKLDALTRMLEMEDTDAMLIFVRTKTATVELAEKLEARGYACAPLNGDIPQAQRERTVGRLKSGKLDLVIATDVAARGLDVERVSHVVNYDIPHDTESYVHRIGRTGRAGRSGEAILFVAPREKRLLKMIERATGQPIEPMQVPTTSDINQARVQRFKQKISDTLATEDLEFFQQLVSDFQTEHDVDPILIATALARMAQGEESLLLPKDREKPRKERKERKDHEGGQKEHRRERRQADTVSTRPGVLKDHPDVKLERYRIEVGHQHEVKPGNIVGAIANEAGVESEYIGSIEIYDDFSTVDLPEGMPKEIYQALKKTWVCGQKLNITCLSNPVEGGGKAAKKPKSGGKRVTNHGGKGKASAGKRAKSGAGADRTRHKKGKTGGAKRPAENNRKPAGKARRKSD